MLFLEKIFLSFILFTFFTTLQAQNNPTKTIAFAQDTMANDFRKAQVYEVRDELAKYPDVKFISSDANGQTSLLIHQIEKFISMKVDAIILGTNDAKAVVPVVAKAYHSGIPIIILDRGIDGEDYTTFINSDNIKIGTLGAEYIAQRLHGKGEVLLFEGLQKADVTQLRTKGFMDEISKYPQIKVIKRTGNYLRKDAILEMQKLIQEGVHIDAIFSQSDSMLSGVRLAMSRYKMDLTSIITIGCDYTSEAQNAIKNGIQTGSILFPLGGTMAAQVVLKLFAKEAVLKHILIPVKLVTKENVEEVNPIF